MNNHILAVSMANCIVQVKMSQSQVVRVPFNLETFLAGFTAFLLRSGHVPFNRL